MELFGFLVGVVILIIGFIMVVFPKQSTNKKVRDFHMAIQKTRASGVVLMCGGIVLLGSCFLII